MPSEPAFAAVDWGTTRFRAWLLDVAGEIVAERRSDEGLLAVPRERFAAVLEEHLAAMGAAASLPVMMCGMAGSRQGWIEAPYVATSARFDDILGGAIAVPGARRDVRIVPGVAQRERQRPDVMRGEETQLAGIASLHGAELLVCMPGTHCKWVRIVDGAVARFQTWLTGELFSVLSAHSILRHALGATPSKVSPDDPVFGEWLDDGLAHPGDAVSHLFRIRASTLLLDMPPDGAAAALSGLLIGNEVGSARTQFADAGSDIVLVASGPLGDLYAEALARAGYTVTKVDAEQAVRKGLLEAARLNFALDGAARAKA
jgi:2-dehydro-3-deoxygalactonokinase